MEDKAHAAIAEINRAAIAVDQAAAIALTKAVVENNFFETLKSTKIFCLKMLRLIS